jgi:DNA-binding MarR family transcriptional regulator
VTTPDDVATRLATAVSLVSRRIRPAYGELAFGHLSTLATLERFGPQRPTDLARTERVTAPTMTRIVTVLEGRGLVERAQSADDARSVTVSITAEGTRLLADARAGQAATVAELLTALDDEQVGLVVAALDALEAVAREAVGGGEVAARR